MVVTWFLYLFLTSLSLSLILLQTKEPTEPRSRGANNTSNHGGRGGDRYAARSGSNHFSSNGMWSAAAIQSLDKTVYIVEISVER